MPEYDQDENTEPTEPNAEDFSDEDFGTADGASDPEDILGNYEPDELPDPSSPADETPDLNMDPGTIPAFDLNGVAELSNLDSDDDGEVVEVVEPDLTSPTPRAGEGGVPAAATGDELPDVDNPYSPDYVGPNPGAVERAEYGDKGDDTEYGDKGDDTDDSEPDLDAAHDAA